jgi:hypothetical protein
VIEQLVELREAIDRAVAAVGPLEGVIQAWEASRDIAPEKRAEPVRGTEIARNGAATPDWPAVQAQSASGDRPAPACQTCGAPLPPRDLGRGGRARQYCDRCRARGSRR